MLLEHVEFPSMSQFKSRASYRYQMSFLGMNLISTLCLDLHALVLVRFLK